MVYLDQILVYFDYILVYLDQILDYLEQILDYLDKILDYLEQILASFDQVTNVLDFHRVSGTYFPGGKYPTWEIEPSNQRLIKTKRK